MTEQREGDGSVQHTGGRVPGDGSTGPALSPLDEPGQAYRECEARVRALLGPYVGGVHELNSLASAIMTSAQEYALTLARLYRSATQCSSDSAAEQT